MMTTIHTIQKLLAIEAPPLYRVDHFFYFKKEKDLDACLQKLLALGFQIDSKHDRNAGLPEDTRWENEEEQSFNKIDQQVNHTIGKGLIGSVSRSRVAWSLVVSAVHSVEEGLWEMHQAFESLAITYRGTYDGHGYVMDDLVDEDGSMN